MESLCGKAIWAAVLAEKPNVWRCSWTTAKHGIGTNLGWGVPNTAWEGPEPRDPPSVVATGDDLWRDGLSWGTMTGEARAGR